MTSSTRFWTRRTAKTSIPAYLSTSCGYLPVRDEPIELRLRPLVEDRSHFVITMSKLEAEKLVAALQGYIEKLP